MSFPGNRPSSTNYALVYSFDRFELYERFSRVDSDWVNFKLVRVKKAAGDAKGNFWFGYRLSERRFAHCHDIPVMREHYPKVYEEVKRYLDQRSSDYVARLARRAA